MLACPCQLLEERIKSPGRSLGVKTNQRNLNKRECEEFEMALQHKLKLRVYKEYLQHVKRPSSRFLLKFCSSTHGLFEELGRHAKGG